MFSVMERVDDLCCRVRWKASAINSGKQKKSKPVRRGHTENCVFRTAVPTMSPPRRGRCWPFMRRRGIAGSVETETAGRKLAFPVLKRESGYCARQAAHMVTAGCENLCLGDDPRGKTVLSPDVELSDRIRLARSECKAHLVLCAPIVTHRK